VRQRLERRPVRRLALLLDHRLRHQQPGSVELRDRVGTATGLDEPAERLDEAVGIWRPAVIVGERRLVDPELRDRQPGSCGVQREHPPDECPYTHAESADRIDHGAQVVDLALRVLAGCRRCRLVRVGHNRPR
jgi:hypothetical protein